MFATASFPIFYRNRIFCLYRITFKFLKKIDSRDYFQKFFFFFKAAEGLTLITFLFYFIFTIRLNLSLKNLFFNNFVQNGRITSTFNFLNPKVPILRYALNFTRKNKNLFFKLFFYILNNNIFLNSLHDNTAFSRRGGKFRLKFSTMPFAIKTSITTSAQIFTNLISNCFVSTRFMEIYHNVSLETTYNYQYYLYYKKRFIKTPDNIFFSGLDAFDFNPIFLNNIFAFHNYGIVSFLNSYTKVNWLKQKFYLNSVLNDDIF